MNIKQRAVVGAIIVTGFIAVSSEYPEENANFGLTKDDIDNIIIVTNEGFDSAELEIFADKPEPVVVPDEPQGPDPDVNKCICKGTGQIVQGDGHITPCPYHNTKLNSCDCGCEKEGCNCEECVAISQQTATIQKQNKGILKGFSGRSN